jgi:putative peptidoglycan lipid II flippase
MRASNALTNAQIARAALIVLLGFLASGLLGFLRTAVLSAQFGTAEAYGAFIAAQRIPEVIFNLVAGGALGSSFIPVFAQLRDGDEADAWQLASAVMTLAALAAAVLGLVVILTAPLLVQTVLLPGRDAAAQALTAELMRLMMVTPFIFAISGLLMGILQTYGMFVLPSVAISMNSIGIILGALLLAPIIGEPYTLAERLSVAVGLPSGLSLAQVGRNSVYGLAWGAVLSALLHLAVQLPGLSQIKAKLRVLPRFSVPGVWDVLRLMGPRVLGIAVVQINFVVNIILTSGMVEGSIVALTTAFNLMFFALGLIGQSVGSAVFPTLAALYAAEDWDGYKDRLANAMRSVLFLAFPATVAFIVFGEPIVSVFEYNNWTSEDSVATAWALGFYAIGIAGFALLEVLSRAFYALADTWTPVVIGVGAMVSNIILSILFAQVIGEPQSLTRGAFAGLALANALTTLVEAALLWWLMRRRIGARGSARGLKDGFVLSGLWRQLLAALVMGAVLLWLNDVVALRGLPMVLLGGSVGGVVFFGVSILLGLDEAKAVPLAVLRRLRRS